MKPNPGNPQKSREREREREREIRPGGLNRGVCASVLSVLCVLPSFGATNPQITKLIKEKQQKYAQLEQCSKKVNGFKIAGISTLGLTAVGIGGNIALASKNKQLDKEINGTNGEGGLRSDLTKEQEKLEQKNAEIAAEKLKIQQKQDCDAKGDGWRWTGTGCDPKSVVTASNSGTGNSNQSGSTTTQTDAKATVAQSEETQQEAVVDGRIIGSTCVAGDLSSNAATGHYIKLARRFTKDKDGWDSKRCYSDSKKEQIVDCSCAADSCKDSNYEVSNGMCVKKAAATPQETTEKNTSLNTPNMDETDKAITLKYMESMIETMKIIHKKLKDEHEPFRDDCRDARYAKDNAFLFLTKSAVEAFVDSCEEREFSILMAEAYTADATYTYEKAKQTDDRNELQELKAIVEKEYRIVGSFLSDKE